MVVSMLERELLLQRGIARAQIRVGAQRIPEGQDLIPLLLAALHEVDAVRGGMTTLHREVPGDVDLFLVLVADPQQSLDRGREVSPCAETDEDVDLRFRGQARDRRAPHVLDVRLEVGERGSEGRVFRLEHPGPCRIVRNHDDGEGARMVGRGHESRRYRVGR